MARSALQWLWATFGVVAVVAGSLSLVLGSAVQPEAGTVSPSMESELRYYAAWYVVAGVLALRTLSRIESETATIRILCAGLFAGGAARAVAAAQVGTPPAILVFLMVVELVLPLVVVPWQAAVARAERTGTRARTWGGGSR